MSEGVPLRASASAQYDAGKLRRKAEGLFAALDEHNPGWARNKADRDTTLAQLDVAAAREGDRPQTDLPRLSRARGAGGRRVVEYSLANVDCDDQSQITSSALEFLRTLKRRREAGGIESADDAHAASEGGGSEAGAPGKVRFVPSARRATRVTTDDNAAPVAEVVAESSSVGGGRRSQRRKGRRKTGNAASGHPAVPVAGMSEEDEEGEEEGAKGPGAE